MILVVGSTGVLGQRAVRLLLADGHKVRAMTRHAENAEDLRRQGAEVAVGDLTDPESLAQSCRGARRVLACAHSLLGRGKYDSAAVDDRGHRSLIDAARAEPVERFVYISALGASPDHPIDFLRTKFAIERYLESSGIPHVILRPSAFMEWHAHIFNGRQILQKGRTFLLGSGTKPRNFVAAGDVAALAVEALTAPMASNRIVEIGGPGNFTNDEVAKLYGRIGAIDLRIHHVPRPLVRLLAAAVRPFHPGVSRVMRLSGLPDDAFPEVFDASADRKDPTFRFTGLEEFVRDQVQRARARGELVNPDEKA
jgi:uncharacterized protein YbjT (DUF2867 family)